MSATITPLTNKYNEIGQSRYLHNPSPLLTASIEKYLIRAPLQANRAVSDLLAQPIVRGLCPDVLAISGILYEAIR